MHFQTDEEEEEEEEEEVKKRVCEAGRPPQPSRVARTGTSGFTAAHLVWGGSLLPCCRLSWR